MSDYLTDKIDYRWKVCILTTAYFPPVSYFVACANSERVSIELSENYQKQSYRSRCEIYGANGIQKLSIPISRGGVEGNHSVPIAEVEVDYSSPWIHNHKKSIESAYKNSPFYDYYADELFAILDLKPDRLIELNTKLTIKMLEFFSLADNLQFSSIYINSDQFKNTTNPNSNGTESGGDEIDLREVIQPKYKGEDFLSQHKMIKPYWQVFNTKQGFIPNLSAIDLLFNEGPDSLSYLRISNQR